MITINTKILLKILIPSIFLLSNCSTNKIVEKEKPPVVVKPSVVVKEEKKQ